MQDATKHYINGQWVISIDGREMAVENPSTERKIATITLGGVADADAGRRRGQGRLSKLGGNNPSDRIAALERLMEVYKTRAEDMAQAISIENGCAYRTGKDGTGRCWGRASEKHHSDAKGFCL